MERRPDRNPSIVDGEKKEAPGRGPAGFGGGGASVRVSLRGPWVCGVCTGGGVGRLRGVLALRGAESRVFPGGIGIGGGVLP